MSPIFTAHIDVALLLFNAFVVFFVGLVIYLNRESRREGFPLEDDVTGLVEGKAMFLDTEPKLFRLPFGRGVRSTADYAREPVELAATRENFPGSPMRPSGNPLVDGIGPAAWANRAKVPDLNFEGHPRIIPLSTTDAIWIAKRDPDPRGMNVTAADGKVAGTVTDVWVDTSEYLIRYLTVDTGTRSVLAPMGMASVNRKGVSIDAITAAQFADAPAIAEAATITLYEEDRVMAYFGGGYLYANAKREEPLL
jgi:photosynthetic reaction center H subunit